MWRYTWALSPGNSINTNKQPWPRTFLDGTALRHRQCHRRNPNAGITKDKEATAPALSIKVKGHLSGLTRSRPKARAPWPAERMMQPCHKSRGTNHPPMGGQDQGLTAQTRRAHWAVSPPCPPKLTAILGAIHAGRTRQPGNRDIQMPVLPDQGRASVSRHTSKRHFQICHLILATTWQG